MASGTFQTPMNSSAGSNYTRNIIVTWSSTNDIGNNRSTITWKATVGSNNASTTLYVIAGPITVDINGTRVLNKTGRFEIRKGNTLGSGTITVDHDSDGTKNVAVAIRAAIYSGSVNNTYSGTITMTRNTVYSLSTSGSNCSITVNRTTSAGTGSTGSVSTGSNKLAKGDVVTITATPSSNYSLSSLTVNGSSFSSGSSYTVSGNVTVAATTQALASTVSAGSSSVNVGGNITLTVTKHNNSYAHSLRYVFTGESSTSGYITSSGGTSSSEVKYTGTNITFTIPSSFYNCMPNSTSGTCVITCKTYSSTSSTTQLGASSTASFRVNTTSSAAKPSVSGTVVDTNSTTTALTGDSSKLILNASTAVCTISASSSTGATITSKTLNNSTISTSKTFTKVTTSSFTFAAKDSRGYSNSYTPSVTTYNYIPVTCIPVINRTQQTGSSLTMTISGNYYNGSFGGTSNTLTLSYRYKLSTASSFGSWTTISATKTYDTANRTYSVASFSISGSFPYTNQYKFEVRAVDKLNTSVYALDLAGGIPVFDWGKNDFRINYTARIAELSSYKSTTTGNESNIIILPRYHYTDLLGSSDGFPSENFLKAVLKQICVDYPNYSNTLFIGTTNTGGQGYVTVYIYDTSVLTDGLPRYSHGEYMGYTVGTAITGGAIVRFGTSNYIWYLKQFISSDVVTVTPTYVSNTLISSTNFARLHMYVSGRTASIHFNASVNAVSTDAFVNIGTIPSSYKPGYIVLQSVPIQSNTFYQATVAVDTNGNIQIYKPNTDSGFVRCQLTWIF